MNEIGNDRNYLFNHLRIYAFDHLCISIKIVVVPKKIFYQWEKTKNRKENILNIYWVSGFFIL